MFDDTSGLENEESLDVAAQEESRVHNVGNVLLLSSHTKMAAVNMSSTLSPSALNSSFSTSTFGCVS